MLLSKILLDLSCHPFFIKMLVCGKKVNSKVFSACTEKQRCCYTNVEDFSSQPPLWTFYFCNLQSSCSCTLLALGSVLHCGILCGCASRHLFSCLIVHKMRMLSFPYLQRWIIQFPYSDVRPPDPIIIGGVNRMQKVQITASGFKLHIQRCTLCTEEVPDGGATRWVLHG